MRNGRPFRVIRIAIAILAVALIGACSLVDVPPPAPDAMIEMIAADEGVQTNQVELLASEFKAGQPYVLYQLSPPFSPRPPNRVMRLRVFLHPLLRPWAWEIAGGGGANPLRPGEGASMSILSAKGDTGSRINTEIYGVGGPDAASIEVTIDGQTYTRDIRDGRGYIILLEQQGVSPSMIDNVRVNDSEGNLLPSPWLVRSGQKVDPGLEPFMYPSD
ncbi:exported hypothetical protein [Nitrolancea hollandica Lb]|uniref:Lipoprotein n=1 Tax=Nitrolancea hollandica Lb TaxID=1129897 RepID=I4EKA4_9BACT|nr:exported hypothetical protein [Nitrolancea hollandica Lb]